MLSYETQLQFKKRVVEKAYEEFSRLDPSSVPTVLGTIPSPKQYGYRTKLTPHFDAPPRSLQSKNKGKGKTTSEDTEMADDAPIILGNGKPWVTRIGFDQKGRRTVMDIEVCLSLCFTSSLPKALSAGDRTAQLPPLS